VATLLSNRFPRICQLVLVVVQGFGLVMVFVPCLIKLVLSLLEPHDLVYLQLCESVILDCMGHLLQVVLLAWFDVTSIDLVLVAVLVSE
jgi:hypothetical protein